MRDTTSGDVPFLLYHFKSSFSHQWYVVRVEQYPNDFYGIKFYLKADKLNPHKYNRMTGLNEFYHYQMKEQSAYALIRRSELDAQPQLLEELNMYFIQHYSNFD